jgi:hypothetical protein
MLLDHLVGTQQYRWGHGNGQVPWRPCGSRPSRTWSETAPGDRSASRRVECDPHKWRRDARSPRAAQATCLPAWLRCCEASGISTWAVEPRDDTAGDGIAPVGKNDRDRRRLPLEGNGRWGRACQDDCRPTSSCANARIRLMSVPAQRMSIRMLRPTVHPKPKSV